jgi:hypothetical protein
MAETAQITIDGADTVETVLREVSLRHHELERKIADMENLQALSEKEIAELRAQLAAAERKLAAIGGIVAENAPLEPFNPKITNPIDRNLLADSFVL